MFFSLQKAFIVYFDLQVNGYAGVDFNADELRQKDVRAACDTLAEHKVTGILATIITDDLDRMCTRLATLCQIREADKHIASMIRGIHIEGPFINPTTGYVGAHPQAAVRPADADLMMRLLDAAGGLARIVTLAPECDPDGKITRMLASQAVTVSAGHCNPSNDQLMASIDAGLSMFTHLGNGCPLMLHRHDNIIQRALNFSDQLAIGFIADGVHVPYGALRNYLTRTGFEHAFVVTDAIAAAGRGPGRYQLAGQQVIVDDQLATWSEDRQNLIGSASTMPSVVERLRNELSLSDDQIEQLTFHNPAKAIGVIP